ncbi:MAG: sigma 54-interacting transcriptional regulator, partial [bacterium]
YHQTPVMMHSIDRNGKLVSVNDFWLTTLGYEREEVIGRNSTEFLTEESQRYFKEVAFPEFLKTGFAKDVGYQMVKKNGEVIDVLLSAIVEKDVTGEMNHTMAFMVDITERKWAEQALLESEERLFRILESAMDAIVAIDNDWQIVLFNEAAEKIFRCPASRAVGHAFDRYLSENFYSLLKSYLKDCQTGKRDKCYLWARDGVTALRADGEEFPVDGTVSQFEMAGRKLYTIILRDINDLMQAEQKLHKLQLEKAYLEEEVTSEYNLGEIVGASKAMQTVYQNIEKVAATDSTVLLTGETGTGKELIARAIHKLSSRKESVMVNVNCAALPMGLVESELFGHVKGAFTGASTKKKGRFELADGGTILLDEVGELPLETQTKLLRVLQEQEFEHVGGTQTKKVNVRVIAASNQNLEEIVKQGGFRADLFYRLNIFPIHIPALRDRLDDIPLLTNYFVRKFSRRIGKRIENVSSKVQEKLMSYSWPGNVRELANILERAVILCEGGVLQQEHIGISLQPFTSKTGISTLQETERLHILKALEQTGGVVGGSKGAAKLLGLKRKNLLTKMKKWVI